MKNRILAFSLAALLFSLVGCLKDEKYMAVDQTAPVVEFPIGGPGVVENSFDVNDISINLDTSIAINIASPQVLDRDVQVTVQVTPTVVTEYNTSHGTAYTALPASAYSIENYTLTIPKGYRIGRFKIRLLFPRFDLTQTYALGLQIVSAPGLVISGNFNKFLWSFNLRNAYDGLYSLRGRTVHPSSPALQGPVGTITGVPLITVGATSVTWGITHPWANGSASSTPAGYEPTFTVNASTNAVTVTNTSIGADNVPGYNSRYVPSSKTFYVAWRYLGATGYREFYDTLTYTGPR